MNPISSIDPTGAKSGAPAVVTAPDLKPEDVKRLRDTAVQMEATFNSYMLDEVVKGLPGTSGGKTDEFSGEVFGGMFKQEIATDMAKKSGPHGVAAQIFQANLKKQAQVEAARQGMALPAHAMIALRAQPVTPSKPGPIAPTL